MQPFALDPSRADERQDAIGAVICEEVSVGRQRLFHKGHCLTEADLPALATVDRPIHLMRLGPDDVHEDAAGMRLARAIAGQGVVPRGPKLSRVNLIADQRGLLRVDGAAVTEMNLQPGIAIFTLVDRLPVLPGKMVASAKITPVAIHRAPLEAAEAIARQQPEPIVQVKPFLPLKIGVVTTEGMSDKVRERFRETVRTKMGWYSGEVVGFSDQPKEPAPVADAMRGFLDQGVDLILAGGGNTIDPLDPTLLALPDIGAEVIAFGAPAHPGSMIWMAYRGDTPILNLASCSMYSKATVADLILPWIMAGERVQSVDFAQLGYGGLLDREMNFRFPPYDAEAVNEE